MTPFLLLAGGCVGHKTAGSSVAFYLLSPWLAREELWKWHSGPSLQPLGAYNSQWCQEGLWRADVLCRSPQILNKVSSTLSALPGGIWACGSSGSKALSFTNAIVNLEATVDTNLTFGLWFNFDFGFMLAEIGADLKLWPSISFGVSKMKLYS